MRTSTLASILALSLTGSLLAQSSRNMTLLSKIPHSPCTTGDVWALDNNHMLIARRGQGFAVVDATNPRNPITKNILPPGYPAPGRNYGVGDIKSDGRYIYASDEYRGGVHIYDAKVPMNPQYLTTLTSVSSVHNMWVDGKNNTLYTNRGYIVDITNKSAPSIIGTVPIGSAHDVIVLDQIAYYSAWSSGISIWDVKNPRQPKVLARHSYSGSRTHNMWPTEDRKHLYTTDETANGHLRIFDISNYSNIRQVGSWKTGPSSGTVHNVQIRSNLAFVSYYKEGLRVLDIRNPTRPIEVAHYDTYVPTSNGCFGGIYAGCWGVYPWTLGKVFVSDLDSGGYILNLDLVPSTFTAKSVTVPPGGTVELDMAYQNNSGTALSGFGVVIANALNNRPLVHILHNDLRTFSIGQKLSKKIRIPVPGNFPRNWTVDFTAYSGTFNPLIVSTQTPLRITVR